MKSQLHFVCVSWWEPKKNQTKKRKSRKRCANVVLLLINCQVDCCVLVTSPSREESSKIELASASAAFFSFEIRSLQSEFYHRFTPGRLTSGSILSELNQHRNRPSKLIRPSRSRSTVANNESTKKEINSSSSP